MRTLSTLLVLLAALSARAQPELPLPNPVRQRVMLIWGGGRTYEEASAVAAAYDDRASTWSRVLELAPGYPRVIPGSDHPGLRQDYFFVALGVCDGEQGAALERVFKALEPLTSSRRVLWEEASGLPCPTIAEGWSFGKGARARVRGGTLNAASFDYVEGQGADERRSWLLVLELFLPKGEVVSRLVEPPEEGLHSKVKSLGPGRGELVLVEHLLDPTCDTHPRAELHARTWRFSVREGEVTTKQAKKLLERRNCPAPEDEGAVED